MSQVSEGQRDAYPSARKFQLTICCGANDQLHGRGFNHIFGKCKLQQIFYQQKLYQQKNPKQHPNSCLP